MSIGAHRAGWLIAASSQSGDGQSIGLSLLTPGVRGGDWGYVDDSGASIASPDPSFFDGHPVWGGIEDVMIDGQYMVKIPRFFVRHGLVAGNPTWWVSDAPAPGYHLHPAFMNGGSPVDQIYVGKYQASMTGAKMDSKPGVSPTVNRTVAQLIADAQARNVSGVDGFMLWSVYQWAAIQWLYLIENATMDSQAKTGMGRVSAGTAVSVSAVDVAGATYRGVVGLWGNIIQAIDGLKTGGGSIHLWDLEGNKSWVITGQSRTAPVGIVYPNVFMDQSAVNYDFANIFIGDTGTVSATNSTASDYQYFNEGSAFFAGVGGDWASSFAGGLFSLYCNVSTTGAQPNVGARLAKI